MAIERMQLPVGQRFDHNNPGHVDAAMKAIADRGHGTGWQIQSFDPTQGLLTVARRSAMTTVTKAEGKTDSYRVELMRGIKPTDGEQIAAQLESDPQHAGYFMTRFEPFISEATMSKLTPDEIRARGAIATVLGVKPWDVGISKRPGGGFLLNLPGNYVPSKHDEKLDEIVQVAIGKVGWYFNGDANKLTGQIVPSKPATFATSIPYPVAQMPASGGAVLPPIPIGQTLAERGDEPNDTLWLDWSAAPHLQLGGITGAGKLLPLDAPIPTPSGWTTMGDLEVGDEVLARDGKPTRVVSLSPIAPAPDLYEITLSDGQTIVADADHQWVVTDHVQRNRKRQAHFLDAVERRNAALDAADSIQKLAAEADGELSQQELFDLIEGIPGVRWTTPQSVRSALVFMEVPRRLATRATAYGASEERGFKASVYPARRALTALAERTRWVAGEEASLDADEEILTTEEMLAAGVTAGEAERRRFAIRVTSGLDLPDADLPVAPYTFGAWLGDGTSRQGAITSMDDEVIATIRREGYSIRRVESKPDSRASTYHFEGLYEQLAGILGRAESKDGRKLDKRIPTAYLRAAFPQRLAVLHGLMDTDGTVSRTGSCAIALTKRDLACDVLELVRSLGIKAQFTETVKPYQTADGEPRHTTVFRVAFTTDLVVCNLQRKYERLPREVRPSNRWLYITSIRPVPSRPGRCIQVDSPDATYLTAGFVPTHNSVTLNVIIAGCLAAGAELAIIDVPQKAVDFENWRPFVRPGGWGCETLEEGATTLEQLYREGERRAELFKQYGAKKLADLPADMRRTMKEVVIVVDEVTGLFTMDAVPKRLESDDPLRMEAESKNYARELIKTFIEKIAAEQRFVGYHLVLSTQVASVSTGISTALRTNLPHKLLLGARATDGNRKLILTDVTRVPQVPDHIKVDSGASLGAGVAELAGQTPSVFKSFYASESDLISQLRGRGIRPLPDGALGQTRPDAAAVMQRFPDMVSIREAKEEAAAPKFGTAPRQYEAWELDPETGKPLEGYARANAARHALAADTQ